MSHLLTRLVDRARGTAASVEPKRALAFVNASPVKREAAEQPSPGFAYGDLVRGQQNPPGTPRDEPGMSSHPVTNTPEEGGTTPAINPAPPMNQQEAKTLPVSDGTVPLAPEVTTAQREYDISVSPARVDAPHITQSEKTIHTIETRTTALSPAAVHRQPPVEDRVIPTSREQDAGDNHQHIPDDPTRHHSETARKFIATEAQRNTKQITPTTQASIRQQRVTPIPVVNTQHTVIHELPQQRDRAPTPPTIQVTIGRIDVRAVSTAPAPAPQRPRKKPQPSLSLDDYLKQRNGGQV